MIQSRSLSRELALLVLGQISENQKINQAEPIESVLQRSLESLKAHWREGLDTCAEEIQIAQQKLVDTELDDSDSISVKELREYMQGFLVGAEKILNGLSASIEIPQLLVMSDQDSIRLTTMKRVNLVVDHCAHIDESLDNVMERWRFKRLPRIDRDILRLAFTTFKSEIRTFIFIRLAFITSKLKYVE